MFLNHCFRLLCEPIVLPPPSQVPLLPLELPSELEAALVQSLQPEHSRTLSFPGGSEVEASACNVGDRGSIPGSGRSPGEGNGNPLQYSCLGNPMDGGA